MKIKIIRTPIPQKELIELARAGYGDMVKAVADLERKLLALGGAYHSEANQKLIDDGSLQPNVWGFNIYPENMKEERLQFTSLINIRPSVGNRTLEIKDERIKERIANIVNASIQWN